MANEIGDKIRRLRKERGLTQSDLADRSGVAFRSIQDIELGKRTPRADTIEMLAQALGVSPNKLLGEVIPSGATLSASCLWLSPSESGTRSGLNETLSPYWATQLGYFLESAHRSTTGEKRTMPYRLRKR